MSITSPRISWATPMRSGALKRPPHCKTKGLLHFVTRFETIPLKHFIAVRNFSRLSTPIIDQVNATAVDHRVNGRLTQVELSHIECEVKFRIWYPDDFQQCPFVLVTSKGTHRHPIPLPEKTPQRVRQQLLELLGTLRQDLPDMTA
jgi:hypothetical protein